MQSFKILASFWSWAAQFESYLVGNSEDRFTHGVALIEVCPYVVPCIYGNVSDYKIDFTTSYDNNGVFVCSVNVLCVKITFSTILNNKFLWMIFMIIYEPRHEKTLF